jgi:hypothetical protein
MAYTKIQVVFDAAEPDKLGEFWGLALGYVLQPLPPGFDTLEDFFASIGIPDWKWGDSYALVDPADAGPRVYFQKVPEGKTAKNRVHLDVRVAGFDVRGAERDSLRAQHVARLVEAGGAVLRDLDEPGGRCTVMQDPEGNEFCVALAPGDVERVLG